MIFLGKISMDSYFGLGEDDYRRLVRSTDSVIHWRFARWNRKSGEELPRQSTRTVWK